MLWGAAAVEYRERVSKAPPPLLLLLGCFCAAAVVLARADLGRASPSDVFGTGSASVAKAATGVANDGGPAATHQNPALLGGAGEQRFRFGLGSARFVLEAATPSQRLDFSDQVGTAQFGLRLPLRLQSPLTDRLALGLHATTPASVIARVRILDSARPQFPLLATHTDSLNLDVGFGVELPGNLRVGAAVMWLANLRGSIAIDAGASGTVSTITDDELLLTQAPIVGAAWHEGPFAFGAVFRGELVSEFDLAVTLEDLDPIVLPPLEVTGIAQYDPAQFQLEAAWSEARWELTVGASYKLWFGLERFKGPSVRCPDDVASCGDRGVPELGTRNTLVPRLSVERELALTPKADAVLRLGYFYEPSPLPAQTGASNIWDNPRHALSFGYAVLLRQPWPEAAFGVALQRHFLVPRRHLKADAAPADPLADVRTRGAVWFVLVDAEVPF